MYHKHPDDAKEGTHTVFLTEMFAMNLVGEKRRIQYVGYSGLFY
jgi:hypothetical protein